MHPPARRCRVAGTGQRTPVGGDRRRRCGFVKHVQTNFEREFGVPYDDVMSRQLSVQGASFPSNRTHSRVCRSLKSHAPIRRLHHGSRFALRAHQATILLILCVRSLSIALTPSRTMPYRARCRHRHRCHTAGPSTLHRAGEEARHEKRAPVQRATSLQIPNDESPAIDPERADLKQITSVSSSDEGVRPSRCLPPAVALSLTSLSLPLSESLPQRLFFSPSFFSPIVSAKKK